MKHFLISFFIFANIVSKGSLVYTYGSYEGDGNATQAITGIGFQPEVVLVKADHASYDGWIATSTMDAGDAKELTGANALATGRISSLDADGFTVGTHDDANASGVTYYFVAFDANSDLEVGSYTGNTGTQEINLAGGFAPEMVWLLGDAGDATDKAFMGMKSNGNEGVYFADGVFGSTNYMSTYDSDGFTVGAWINTNTKVYHYVAFNEAASSLVEATYIGDDNATKAITGLGYEPDFVMVQSAGNSGVPSFRTAAMDANEALSFNAAAANTEYIRSLDSDGFTVGTDNAVNANGATYIYTAFKGGTVLPVELMYFKVNLQNRKEALLQWKTSSEINNEKFIIEKSYDGIIFFELAEVTGAGNSFAPNTYSYYDLGVEKEQVYYRLKQVDFDGSFEVFGIRVVSSKENRSFDVFPNPINIGDPIYITTPYEGVNNIKIYNLKGELVYSSVIIGGEFSSTIELKQVSFILYPGNYILEVSNNVESTQQKIIIK